jgi:hypothetical protein
MTEDELRSLIAELTGIEDPAVTVVDGLMLHWLPSNDRTY